MTELKQKILDKLNAPMVWALATVTEESKPWVRYVTPRADEDLTIWCATFINSRKVGQIRNNPEVHLTAGVSTFETAESFVQVQGRAEILTDAETKKAIWSDHLKGLFSGPDDSNLAVCKITPYRIEYQKLGPVPPEVWES